MIKFLWDLIKLNKTSMINFQCPKCGQDHKRRVLPHHLEQGQYTAIGENRYLIESKACDYCQTSLMFNYSKDGAVEVIDIEHQAKWNELDKKQYALSKKISDYEEDIECTQDDIKTLQAELKELKKEKNDQESQELIQELSTELEEAKVHLPQVKQQLKEAEKAFKELEELEEKLTAAYDKQSDKLHEKRLSKSKKR